MHLVTLLVLMAANFLRNYIIWLYRGSLPAPAGQMLRHATILHLATTVHLYQSYGLQASHMLAQQQSIVRYLHFLGTFYVALVHMFILNVHIICL